MRYSETPARRAPALWVEVDGKRTLCALPDRRLRRLGAAASACRWGRHARGKSAVRRRQQAGRAAPRIKAKGTCMQPPHFTSGKHRGVVFPQNCNPSGGSPGMAHLPAASSQVCAPKDERHSAVCWHTSSFLPFLLLQKLLT